MNVFDRLIRSYSLLLLTVNCNPTRCSLVVVILTPGIIAQPT